MTSVGGCCEWSMNCRPMTDTAPKACTVKDTAWTNDNGMAVILNLRTSEQDFLKATIGSRRRVLSEADSKISCSRPWRTSNKAQLITCSDSFDWLSSREIRSKICCSCSSRSPACWIDCRSGYFLLIGWHTFLMVSIQESRTYRTNVLNHLLP